MPPKPKFTREEVVDTAIELIKDKGIEALTARELGAKLGSSARPIFTVSGIWKNSSLLSENPFKANSKKK